ncbi:bifunctional demethylmenaquinone methyltransferase/2-methoxy-6-polyprenyl-1,4-benzoquinol methylase UbiE [Algisphaera agarilytica]|uniref:Demethylmenaquinone methyltransferase n=1 Tax=Algisphaera agarilytica TaxID=1385975 RepID=A0A7X0LMK5_9BACT|nr:bifunctional demethylmenaquinone methyltransferase/2-methoxy-6-polyprenyl-1,4-benzoquinol methylase UbiE [Algisphaera agarilytica]MBB6431118.1 demethylmenaquinone methyltransferase/2-methoxy-6-polyprenyl-1,4-benzoquinol methylase [Algisphaera agarilytica]
MSTDTATLPPQNTTTEPAWTESRLDNPHAEPDKARRVEAMFAAIAPSYDLNNRVHSFGRDQAWRRTAVKLANVKPTDTVLDVACGTGDLSMAFCDGGAQRVVGVDFTVPMLDVAQTKKPTGAELSYHAGDALHLPLADQSVDIVSIAFGIRNVTDPMAALREFHRVLRPGGRLIVLEFTVPANPVMRMGYNFYCGWLMPKTATLISGDKSGAYKYLPRSVSTFTGKAELIDAMQQTGFGDVSAKSLTMGIAACYRGVKPG